MTTHTLHEGYIVNVDAGGLFHCEDGPAVNFPTEKSYYLHGKLHRLDGPAIITDNSKEWWIAGKPHRSDGPARMYLDTNTCEWWFDGVYSEQAVLDKSVFMEHWNKEN